jgi:site-specific DNA-adenine methylase
MNHFFFAYAGNKRSEFKFVKDNLYLKRGIKHIVEPFCGSSAISFNIWLEHGDKYKYYLNDIDDQLIKVYNLFKNNQLDDIIKTINTTKNKITSKEEYTKMCKNKEKTIYEYFVMHRFYSIRPGLYDIDMNKNDFKLNEKQLQFIEFINKPYVYITNDDWQQIYNKQNTKDSLIVFDPPYLDACNEFYSDKRSINVYKYFYDNKLHKQSSKICFILEKMWIIDMLFGKYEKQTYNKTYQSAKRKTLHSIYTNY